MNNCLIRVSVPEEAWEKNQREIQESEEERLEGENMDRFRILKRRQRQTTDKPTNKLSVQDPVEVQERTSKIGRPVMLEKIKVDRKDSTLNNFSKILGTGKRELDGGISSPAKRVKTKQSISK